MYMYVFTSLDLQKQHEDEKHWQKSWRGYYYTTSIQLFRIFCPKKKFCWEKFFIGVSIFHFYGNVPWKLHLAINVNTPMQFLSLLNVIKYFSSFSEIFFAIVCAVQAQELGLCLTGKTCRRWRQCHSSTWGPKCWPKYGISLRSVVLVGSQEKPFIVL